jgi:hypothetical protein
MRLDDRTADAQSIPIPLSLVVKKLSKRRVTFCASMGVVGMKIMSPVPGGFLPDLVHETPRTVGLIRGDLPSPGNLRRTKRQRRLLGDVDKGKGVSLGEQRSQPLNCSHVEHQYRVIPNIAVSLTGATAQN